MINSFFLKNFNFTNLIKEIPTEGDALLSYKKYVEELNKITKFFKEMDMKFEGEIDFIIKQVDGKDIIDILENRNKKYFFFWR